MPRRKGYYTNSRWARPRVERRIKIPQSPKRPLRFQIRSILRKEYIRKDPWWFIMRRRGLRGRRPVGENPLEARAVPSTILRGTLPERIVYKYLVVVMKFVPGVDFTFQTSLQGGRIDVGGIVADIIFEHMKIVIQVQGPTHEEYLRIRKDEEQRLALAEMGYETYYLEVPEIYDASRLEERMRRIFNWLHGVGTAASPQIDEPNDYEKIITELNLTLNLLGG